MSFPADLRYTKEHEWIRIEEGGNAATVGITDFAQHELGDIVFVELQSIGAEIEKDGQFGTVEAVKTVSELFMPVSGKITDINTLLDGKPELVNEDPYGDGWMVKIEITNPAELEDLLTAEAYESMVG